VPRHQPRLLAMTGGAIAIPRMRPNTSPVTREVPQPSFLPPHRGRVEPQVASASSAVLANSCSRLLRRHALRARRDSAIVYGRPETL
jgi:hypothetical protein